MVIKIIGVFIVSCRDAAKILETPEHAFNDVSTLVTRVIEWTRLLPVGLVGNDRLDMPGCQIIPPMIGIISFVSEQIPGVW